MGYWRKDFRFHSFLDIDYLMKSKTEKELLASEIALQKTAQTTVRLLLEGDRLGYNNALSWAADWIINSAASNGNPAVIEFAQNMAMSLKAHKKKPNPPGFAITPAAGFSEEELT